MENTKTTYTAAGNTANAVSRTICFLSLQRSSGKRRANLPAEKLEWDIFRRSKSASSWPDYIGQKTYLFLGILKRNSAIGIVRGIFSPAQGGEMGKEHYFTASEHSRVNRLVRAECANYVDGNCILLDDGINTYRCVQEISWHPLCRYFTGCVLLLDPVLQVQIGQGEKETKRCVICGREFVPGSNRSKYCSSCAKLERRKQCRVAKQKQRSQRASPSEHAP